MLSRCADVLAAWEKFQKANGHSSRDCPLLSRCADVLAAWEEQTISGAVTFCFLEFIKCGMPDPWHFCWSFLFSKVLEIPCDDFETPFLWVWHVWGHLVCTHFAFVFHWLQQVWLSTFNYFHWFESFDQWTHSSNPSIEWKNESIWLIMRTDRFVFCAFINDLVRTCSIGLCWACVPPARPHTSHWPTHSQSKWLAQSFPTYCPS